MPLNTHGNKNAVELFYCSSPIPALPFHAASKEQSLQYRLESNLHLLILVHIDHPSSQAFPFPASWHAEVEARDLLHP